MILFSCSLIFKLLLLLLSGSQQARHVISSIKQRPVKLSSCHTRGLIHVSGRRTLYSGRKVAVELIALSGTVRNRKGVALAALSAEEGGILDTASLHWMWLPMPETVAITRYWNVTSCNPIGVHQCSGGTYRLLQDWSVTRVSKSSACCVHFADCLD
jgi:hypothetical protein